MEDGTFEGELLHPGRQGMELQHQRRFVVADTSILTDVSYVEIIQAYVLVGDGYAIRVRRQRWQMQVGGPFVDIVSTVTAMGPRLGADREKPKMVISDALAVQLIRRAEWVSRKRRYELNYAGEKWDIDEFIGENSGLVIAEVTDLEATVHKVQPPAWVGKEIINDPKLDNDQLAKRPISKWTELERQDLR